ncbi:putative protein ycf23 [Hordeum vulgare]|nr:putative protein ycf23 [Hordeum vulgare]
MAVPQPGGGEAAGRIQEHKAHDWADITGGAMRYIIKDLGMALEVGDGQEEEANVLPGSALYRQMFSAMAATGDGELCLQGLITVVERPNDIHKLSFPPAELTNSNVLALQFVDEKVHWMHIDMAGPVWNDKKHVATGFGVSTLVEWVLKNSSSS